VLLRDAHVPLGGRLGPVPGGQAVLDYAPLDREAGHLARAAVADWGFHLPLAVRGDGAEKLLHNLLTSDVAGLGMGRSQPSLLLTPKGKVVGMLRVARHERDHIDVLCEAACAAELLPALARYAAVGKVPVEDRSQQLGLLLALGPRAGQAVQRALGCPPPKWHEAVATPAGNVLLHDGLASPPGYLLMVRADQARDAWERLAEACRAEGGGPVGWHAVEAARVRAGIPRFGAEATEEALPGEAGLDPAVVHTKGCYVGQEVVARIQNLGHVNRLAVRLAPRGPVQPGEAVRAAGQEVGKVTSVALGPGPSAALAVVRREHAQRGAALDIGGRAAEVTGLAQWL
jgi:folate-binding protein YgfZ